MRAVVELREKFMGLSTAVKGEVDEGWLERGWVVVSHVERWLDAGAGAWAGAGSGKVWFPATSVVRMTAE
jgi:hypothetical protein